MRGGIVTLPLCLTIFMKRAMFEEKTTNHTEDEHLFFDGKQNQFRFLLLHLHEVTTGNFIYRSVKEKSHV